jgi:hypothetical protein
VFFPAGRNAALGYISLTFDVLGQADGAAFPGFSFMMYGALLIFFLISG